MFLTFLKKNFFLAVKKLQKQHSQRIGLVKEDRVKSPLGYHAIEDQNIGYSNANMYT